MNSPYQSLYDVISVALSCMMLVLIIGQAIPKTSRQVPCSAHLENFAGVKMEFLLICKVENE